jgi:nucleotide-binding universal stress UspA family protein
VFKHILVPLDGSRLAESAIPAAAFLAKLMGSSVTLLHIIEKNAPQVVHGERHLTDPVQANNYLNEIAARAFPTDYLLVETHVHTEEQSNIARSIAAHVSEFTPDLIILCAHGHGGLRDFLFGSIAQQVISIGRTPVLLIPSVESDQTSPFTCQHILVPIDSSTEHTQGLKLAIELAEISGAGIHLVIVVPTLGTLKSDRAAAGRLLPATMAAMLDLVEEQAQAVIANQAALLQLVNVPVTSDVHRGDPAKIIASEAQNHASDIIVLATHGKSGQRAFWSESVAPKVSRLAHIPLLFVPIYED